MAESKAKEPKRSRWYDSTPFWGGLGLGIAFLLPALIEREHDLRWLFIPAWPCLAFSIWSIAKRGPHAWRVIVPWALFFAVALGLVATNLPPRKKPASPVQVAEQKPLSHVPQILPPPSNPESLPSNDSPKAGRSSSPVSAKAPPRITMTRDVHQSANGSCNANVIGGDASVNCTLGLPPRQLSDSQRAKMSEILAGVKPDHHLVIGSLVGDEEAARLAIAIADTFEKAGWQVERLIGRQMMSGSTPEAVMMSLYAAPGSTSTENLPAKTAVNALNGAGTTVGVNFDSTLDPGALNLFVGANRPRK